MLFLASYHLFSIVCACFLSDRFNFFPLLLPPTSLNVCFMVFGLRSLFLLEHDTHDTHDTHYKYESTDKLVVVDIDGTITKSNITGYWQTVFLGVYSYVHEGLVMFLDTLSKSFGFNIVYLTSRPITHVQETKNLLEGVQAVDGYEMPMGPLFMNKESISMAIYREVIANTAMEFKAEVMLSVTSIFRQAGSPFRCL